MVAAMVEDMTLNLAALFVVLLFAIAGFALMIGTWVSEPHGDPFIRAAVAGLGLVLIGLGGSLVWDLFR